MESLKHRLSLLIAAEFMQLTGLFTVTPARPSLAAAAAIAVGVAMLLNYETLDIIAFVGLLPLVMGVLAVLVGARYRRAATITVTEEAVCCSGRTWSFAEIADFNVRLGSRVNADEPAVVTHRAPDGGLIYGSKSTSAMLSRVLNRRMIERSYLISLRSRAGSDETVLSGGLTLDCAEALQRDLRAVIAANTGPVVGHAAQ